ncbi:hypothetical protein BCR36DRAFT_587778 [Piromyces finnis]|uniref:Cation efflux protein n=1 Tax=Piromyces finnis TaxID=1754191 RepID=A0A1Y1UUP0_9FUNG|nr:hypothetical protein BCR36DRAFT_587778 [Piromyces finnis]|eukprot:ORX41755.1 hypothetical protein BCR36DRAFT_587778 [Piromyces finnis]
MRNYSIEGSEEERTALLVDNDIQNNSYSSIERERVICRGYESNNESKSKLVKVVCVSSLFFLLEFTGGLISGSLALLSDSFHLLSDVIGFLISLIAVIVSQKKATKKYSFGYHRAEIIGALLSLVFIWVLTIGLIIGAINRLKNPVEINAKVMLITSIAGVIINIILALTLEHGHSHSHSHGHSHGHSHSHSHGNIQSNNHEHEHHVNVNEHHVNEHEHHINEHNNEENGHNLIEHYEKENINVKAAIIHIVGDLISSIGVVIAAVIIYFDPSKVYIDPICTFIFSIIVIFTTINLLKQALSVIMESTPDHIDPDKVKKDLSEIKGIVDIHDLHIWNITVGKPAIAAHINVKKENPVFEEYERILNNAQFILCTKYNIHHTTLQIEYINEEDHPLLDYNSSSSSSTQNNKNVTIDIQPLDNNYREYSSIHCNTEL